MSPWIFVGGKRYPVTAVAANEVSAGGDEFIRSVLDFTRAWYSDAPSFTVTTSGSTGPPKEITLTRESMIASSIKTQQAIGLKKGYTALLCLDPRYIAGKMMLVRSFVIGMNVVAVPPSANPMADVPHDITIDFAALVPYQLRAIVGSQKDALRLSTIKSIMIGGAALERALQKTVGSFPEAVYATYGMTETITHIALQKLNPPGVQDYFKTLEGVHIEKDARGCLVIQAEYLGNEKIVTNDLVDVIDGNKFRWLGRVDNIINSGGIKLIPERIEEEIAEAFGRSGVANRFFLKGIPDDGLGSKLVLVMEGEKNDNDIMALLRKTLSKFEMPREIQWVDKFLETETQKVRRSDK